MTTTLMKTKAELSLAADFAARGKELPGTAAIAAARSSAMADFEKHGLPHRRVEAWKYTDLRANLTTLAPIATHDDTAVTQAEITAALGPLATLDADRIVFVNGSYRRELSTAKPGTTVMTLGEALRSGTAPAFSPLHPDAGVASLNAALATDGAAIEIAEKSHVAKPILLVMIAAGAVAKLTALRHQINVGRGAVATVIEAHVALHGGAAGQTNSVIECHAADGAHLTHVLVSFEGSHATHLETISATLGANATFHSFQLTAGTGLVRNQSFVTFAGEHAKLDISGLMLGRGRNHIDTTLVIDHAVPHCESRELFKAVLDDTARAVFQGKVIVRPDAQKTDGKQMAKALMLSEACEFDSKPELEIYADDVVCGHGATVAEIDPAMMFYLRSRGIPQSQARAMLIESFVGEALEKMNDETLRESLSEIARGWLTSAQM